MKYFDDSGYPTHAMNDLLKEISKEFVGKLPTDVEDRKEYLLMRHALMQRLEFDLDQNNMNLDYLKK